MVKQDLKLKMNIAWFISMFLFCLSTVIANHVLNVNIDTTIQDTSSWGDSYIKSGDLERFNFTVINAGGDNLTQVNITVPRGFNVTQIIEPINWNTSNHTTNGIVINITYTTNDATIGPNENQTFCLELKLNNSPPIDGNHSFTITTLDNSTNTSTISINVTVDNTNPSIVINTPLTGNYSEALAINVTVADNNLDTNAANYSIGNFTDNYTKSATPGWSPLVQHMLTDYFNDTLNTTKFVDGPYTLYIKANDLLGNQNISSVNITIDNNAPTVYALTTLSPTNININISINATVVDNGTGVQNCTLYVNATLNYTMTSLPENIFNAIISDTLTDGTYNLTVNCTDYMSNEENNSTYLSVDTAPPNITIISPSSGTYNESYMNLTFKITDNYAETMNCSLYIDNEYQKSNESTTNSTETIFTLSICDGHHNLTVNCSDSAKNFNTDTVNIITDTAPPDFHSYFPHPQEFFQNNTISYNISIQDNGTGVNNDSVSVTITYPDGQNGISTLYNISHTIWQFNLTNTSQIGRHTLTFFASDSLGKQNTKEEWFEVYAPTNFYGNATNTTNMQVTFTFRRPGTNHILHQFTSNASNGWYNKTISRRVYDLETTVLYPLNDETHRVTLYGINTDAANISNSIIFSNISKITDLPNTIEYPVTSIIIETQLTFSSATLSLNYSKNPNITSQSQALCMDIYECSGWINTACNTSWTNKNGMVHTNNKTISTDISINKSNTYAYVAIEPSPLQFQGDTCIQNYDLGNNITINFTFYRPGTNAIIHNFTSNDCPEKYNNTIRNRIYDLETNIILYPANTTHIINFYNVNISASSQKLFNVSNATNITDSLSIYPVIPASFDLIPPCYPLTLKNVGRPTTIDDNSLLAGLVIESNLTYDTANITLDYKHIFNEIGGTVAREKNIRIYKCSSENWNYTLQKCGADPNWELLSDTSQNSSADTISANIGGYTSAYIAAEYHPPSGDGNGYVGSDSGGGGSGGSGTVCGNGICELGENTINCPQDCITNTTCGNGVCDIGENIDNCPQDCGLKGMSHFSIESNLKEATLARNESKTYLLWITNNIDKETTASISITGDISPYVTLEKESLTLSARSIESIGIETVISSSALPGVYTGDIVVTVEGNTQTIPITLTVVSEEVLIDLSVETLTKNVVVNGIAKFHIIVYNFEFKNNNINLSYLIKDVKTETVFKEEHELITINTTKSFIKEMSLNNTNISVGEYFLEVTATCRQKTVSATDAFNVIKPFWTPMKIKIFGLLIALLVIGIITFYSRVWYIKWKLAKARYIFPLDYKKLPGKSDKAFRIGCIAETDIEAWFDPDMMVTHMLTAGATGSGKSVSASVFVEEALNKNIPVVVFDPTAQWTGFVRPCKDPNLLRYYPQFGMKPEDAKPFKGLIVNITDPKMDLDFKKLMNPGEITVFNLRKLKPKEYDEAVKNVVDSIFKEPWEESINLKMIVIFDEVHRLLEKYGGTGGYISLEKACREFRKWGIGLIMISQVLIDFKDAVQGNILTDIQMNTKSSTDIGRAREKYGKDFAERISRQAVGVGMIQNPKYNNGKPYFVQFRPTQHSPHKIPEEELERYEEFAEKIKELEQTIANIKKKGKDTFDVELELKLAKNKLKEGRFKMAEIYIDSLKNRLKLWNI